MAHNESRRQKLLLKKKRKDKDRRHKKSNHSFDEYGFRKNIIKNARVLPLYECFINPRWQEDGLATILISRKQPNGNIAFGVYMVDIFCLGLKSTFSNANIPLKEYDNDLKAKTFKLTSRVECHPDLAHQIIYGAIDFAGNLGFSPDKDFELSKYILEARSEKYYFPDFKFGMNGKPYFMAGPNDNVDYIMRKLERSVGAGNFHFTHPMGM